MSFPISQSPGFDWKSLLDPKLSSDIQMRAGHETELKAVYAITPPMPGEDYVVVRSRDGYRFSISVSSLRSWSPFFHALVALPQPPGTQEDIPFEERAEVIYPLLAILSSKVLSLKSFPINLVFDLATAADKFDLDQLKHIIHLSVLREESPFRDSPLELYVLCCKYQWEEGRRVAMQRSLALDFSIEWPHSIFEKLTPEASSNLLYFRFNRLNQMPRPSLYLCDHCRDEIYDYFYPGMAEDEPTPKITLKHMKRDYLFGALVLEELYKRPDGSSVLKPEFTHNEVFTEIFSTGHDCEECDEVVNTWRHLRLSIEGLKEKDMYNGPTGPVG